MLCVVVLDNGDEVIGHDMAYMLSNLQILVCCGLLDRVGEVQNDGPVCFLDCELSS